MIARLLAIAMGAVMTGSAAAAGLEGMRWEVRPLLVFAPTADDPALERQSAMLADAADGLADRRVAVLIVEPGGVRAASGEPAERIDAAALRSRFGVPDGAFRVILVGLDGGAKLVASEPLPADTLFATVDGMPMRQRELRERGAAD